MLSCLAKTALKFTKLWKKTYTTWGRLEETDAPIKRKLQVSQSNLPQILFCR